MDHFAAMSSGHTVLLMISILIGIAVGLITLNWFFKDAEDSTRSFQEFSDSWRPWWASKFGIWLAVSFAAGMVVYYALPILWQRLLTVL